MHRDICLLTTSAVPHGFARQTDVDRGAEREQGTRRRQELFIITTRAEAMVSMEYVRDAIQGLLVMHEQTHGKESLPVRFAIGLVYLPLSYT